MHCDAAQSCGKLKVDVKELGVDMLTIAGHKIYAPPGVGALYIRDGVLPRVSPLLQGGGQEGGARGGTESCMMISALGAASAAVSNGLAVCCVLAVVFSFAVLTWCARIFPKIWRKLGTSCCLSWRVTWVLL